MDYIRKVRKVGGSLTVSIPPVMGFCEGDYVRIVPAEDKLIITRVS